MLVRTGDRWNFESELVVETFIWENLEKLLPFTPLKRQYQCRGEICDIVAIGQSQELVILEIKNTEDRYVVQQLTRYYDNLRQERPWSEQIDYLKPVRLVAIAPNFHRHNFVDQKYCRLDIEFFTFETKQLESRFSFALQDVQTQQRFEVELPYIEVKVPASEDLPDPPQGLLNALGLLPIETRQSILEIRHQILSFDPRMQEIATSESVRYGRSQNRLCAELCFDRKQGQIVLFLWIPFWRRHDSSAIGRHRIWTDWQTISAFIHMPSGLGKARPSAEWKQIPVEKRPRKNLDVGKVRLIAHDFYAWVGKRIGCEEETNALPAVVEVALKTWQAKL
jgi:RecB family endonuclease NucS